MSEHRHVAFRCKTCGRLEHAEHAGENLLPHACSVCGSGVKHAPAVEAIAEELGKPDLTAERRLQLAAELSSIAKAGPGAKTYDSDNWEVLADATPERLTELGIPHNKVTKHKPEVITVPNGRYIVRTVEETMGVKDKS